jgi:hypothetical protein
MALHTCCAMACRNFTRSSHSLINYNLAISACVILLDSSIAAKKIFLAFFPLDSLNFF